MSIFENAMRKLAYVPFTPAAQQAVDQQMQGGQPPMDPNAPPPQDPAMAQGGMPPMPPQGDPNMMQGGQPPMDPNMAGGQPQGQMPPIQIVPGPNGEQIDAETGFIVLDPQQGIEQDPLTGILFNKSLMQFASPDGMEIPPEQAIQMIEQARQGGGQPQGDPNAGAMPPQGQPPMDPNMMQGQPPPQGAPAPMPPPPMQQTAAAEPGMDPSQLGVSMDPSTGMPIDPSTGMPVDPATGAPIDPNTGAAMAPAPQQPNAMGGVEALFQAVPGLQEFIAQAPKQLEAQDKTMGRIMQDITGFRTDLQGLRREIQKSNSDNDTMLARMDELLARVETLNAQSAMQALPQQQEQGAQETLIPGLPQDL